MLWKLEENVQLFCSHRKFSNIVAYSKLENKKCVPNEVDDQLRDLQVLPDSLSLCMGGCVCVCVFVAFSKAWEDRGKAMK